MTDIVDGLFEMDPVEPQVDDRPVGSPVALKTFRRFERDQDFLFPPSLDDWLSKDHLARFVAELVDSHLDLDPFYDAYVERRGGPPYDPRLMVQILLFGYITGVRSSRGIEKACTDSVPFRWLAVNSAPDFRAVARFRKKHLEAFAALFLEALQLCRAAGMVKLGQVALDGTKLGADASKRKAMSYDRMLAKEKDLVEQINQILAEAEQVDNREDAQFGQDRRGDELPDDLTDTQSRSVALRKAKEALKEAAQSAYVHGKELVLRRGTDVEVAECQGNTEAEHVDISEERYGDELVRAESRLATIRKAKEALEEEARQAAYEHGKKLALRRGMDVEVAERKGAAAAEVAVPKPKVQRNFTDPESRIMRTASGGFAQCYNAQAVVDSGHQVIVAVDLNNCAADVNTFIPMTEMVADNTGCHPDQFLADAGYCSADNLAWATEHTKSSGTDFFVATGRIRRGEPEPLPPIGPVPDDATDKQRMARKLRAKPGKTVYARRKAIVEPVFGQMSTLQNAKQLLLRGQDAAKHEWALLSACHNLRKLHGNIGLEGLANLAAT